MILACKLTLLLRFNVLCTYIPKIDLEEKYFVKNSTHSLEKMKLCVDYLRAFLVAKKNARMLFEAIRSRMHRIPSQIVRRKIRGEIRVTFISVSGRVVGIEVSWKARGRELSLHRRRLLFLPKPRDTVRSPRGENKNRKKVTLIHSSASVLRSVVLFL